MNCLTPAARVSYLVSFIMKMNDFVAEDKLD